MEPPPQPPSFSGPVRLSPHLYVVLSEFPHRSGANAYLITGQHPTLIDCGSQDCFPNLARGLTELEIDGADLVHVIATHGHYDHVQGIHSLRQHWPHLPLLIHEADVAGIQSGDPYLTAAVVYSRDFKPIPPQDRVALVDGQQIAAGDGMLTVHHTPGHTDGSICLAGNIDDVDILFTGDTIFGAMSSLAGADVTVWTRAIEVWRQSLVRVAALPFDSFLPGHEPYWDLPIPKQRLTRAIPYFGRMLNPWFSLADDEVAAAGDVLVPKPDRALASVSTTSTIVSKVDAS